MQRTKKIRVGERVRFGSPWHRRDGIVIEDRGPLGGEGRQVIRVRYAEDVAGDGVPEYLETELAAENVEVLQAVAA